jgi:hypothetical protein
VFFSEKFPTQKVDAEANFQGVILKGKSTFIIMER